MYLFKKDFSSFSFFAMDAATLSQLACAAAGIAAQLHRDEANAAALAAVTLDLERARMTAEDFRNGGGPNTAFMHWPMNALAVQQRGALYPRLVALSRETMRDHERLLQRGLEHLDDLTELTSETLAVLARLVRARGSRSAVHGAMDAAEDLFNAHGWSSRDVEAAAADGVGPMSLGLEADA